LSPATKKKAARQLHPLEEAALERLQHLRGCPQTPERIETWLDTVPKPRERVGVAKCNDCGAHESTRDKGTDLDDEEGT
jgi:hypothetical protein